MKSEENGEKFIKLLTPDGRSTFQGKFWNLPRGEKRALKMRNIQGNISACVRGYHVTTVSGAMSHWMQHIDEVFWMVEIGDNYFYHDDKYVSREARILGRLPDEELPKDIEVGKRIVDDLLSELSASWGNEDINFIEVPENKFYRNAHRMDDLGGIISYGNQRYGYNEYTRKNDAFLSALSRYAARQMEYISGTYGYRGWLSMIINAVVRWRFAVEMGAVEDNGILEGMNKIVHGMKIGKLYKSYNFTRNEPF